MKPTKEFFDEILDEIEDKFQLDFLTNNEMKKDFVKLFKYDLSCFHPSVGQQLDTAVKFINLKLQYSNCDLYLLEALDNWNCMEYLKEKYVVTLGSNGLDVQKVISANTIEDIERKIKQTTMSPISVYRHGKNVKFTTKIMIDEEEKTS